MQNILGLHLPTHPVKVFVTKITLHYLQQLPLCHHLWHECSSKMLSRRSFSTTMAKLWTLLSTTFFSSYHSERSQGGQGGIALVPVKPTTWTWQSWTNKWNIVVPSRACAGYLTQLNWVHFSINLILKVEHQNPNPHSKLQILPRCWSCYFLVLLSTSSWLQIGNLDHM